MGPANFYMTGILTVYSNAPCSALQELQGIKSQPRHGRRRVLTSLSVMQNGNQQLQANKKSNRLDSCKTSNSQTGHCWIQQNGQFRFTDVKIDDGGRSGSTTTRCHYLSSVLINACACTLQALSPWPQTISSRSLYKLHLLHSTSVSLYPVLLGLLTLVGGCIFFLRFVCRLTPKVAGVEASSSCTW